MMDIFLLYLWTRLDAAVSLFLVLAGVSLIVLFACLFYRFVIVPDTYGKDEREEKKQAGSRAIKTTIFFACIFNLAHVAIPTQRDVAVIIAGTATYRAITSERGSKIASAFADYIEAQALELLEKGKKK